MDIKMPDLDGLEATRQILAEDDHETAVQMLTTFDLNEYVYDALRAGASGFLLENVLPEDLIAAVRVVAGGDELIAPALFPLTYGRPPCQHHRRKQDEING